MRFLEDLFKNKIIYNTTWGLFWLFQITAFFIFVIELPELLKYFFNISEYFSSIFQIILLFFIPIYFGIFINFNIESMKNKNK